MEQKVQESYKGLPLNVMAYSKEIFDALKSTEATIKISALFNYLGPGQESDLKKRENLIQFAKKCVTREIVGKIKSNSGVEETEEAYNKRIAQEVYNTAKITENIRLGTDDKGDVHFYVKFGKRKEVRDEYEINMEDTLRVIGEIYQQIIIDIDDEEKMPLEYLLGQSTIKRVTEDDVRKIELRKLEKELEEQRYEMTRLQHIVSENEKMMRQVEEEKAKREIELQAQILELTQFLQQQKEKNAKLQNKLKEIQKQCQEDDHDTQNYILSNSEKEAIIKAIKIEYDGKNLSIPTISNICDATLKFAAPEFKRLTKADRQGEYFYVSDLRFFNRKKSCEGQLEKAS